MSLPSKDYHQEQSSEDTYRMQSDSERHQCQFGLDRSAEYACSCGCAYDFSIASAQGDDRLAEAISIDSTSEEGS